MKKQALDCSRGLFLVIGITPYFTVADPLPKTVQEPL